MTLLCIFSLILLSAVLPSKLQWGLHAAKAILASFSLLKTSTLGVKRDAGNGTTAIFSGCNKQIWVS